MEVPIALENHLVFIDQEENTAYLLEAVRSNPSPKPLRVQLPPNPIQAMQRKGSDNDELLLLCMGQEESEEEDRVPPTLVVLNGKGIDRSYELTARFTGLISSADGRYAFLFFMNPNPQTLDEVDSLVSFSNQFDPLISFTNQVAFIDLNQDPKAGQNPVLPRLNSDDDSIPSSVAFSQKFAIGDKTHRLAVVLFDAQISILDLDYLKERRATSIPLEGVTPEQILFGEEDSKIYVRGSSSSEIYVVLLTPNPNNTDTEGNDFSASLNILGAGQQPTDMALYQDNGKTKLLAISAGGKKAVVLDTSSGKRSEIPFTIQANRILMYKAKAPHDDYVEKRALLYQENENGTAIAFLDIEGLEERLERNLESVQLNNSYNSTTILKENHLLMLTDNQSSLSLLNLPERTVSPAVTPNIREIIPDLQSNKLWLTPDYQKKIGFLDLKTMEPGEVRLDAEVTRIIPLTSGKNKRIAILHPGTVGYLTLLDAVAPSRDTAVSLQGYFISNILN